MKQNNQELIRHIQEQFAQNFRPIPSKQAAANFINRLIDSLFPVSAQQVISELELRQLELQLWELLLPLQSDIEPCDSVIAHFFGQLPSIYDQMTLDARAFLDSDPAARSIEEVVAAYPGFYAIAVYRFAHILYQQKIPILPRIISEYAHSKTGIDIHPGATIGDYFFIDHGTGVVIGETAIIGNNVKIYQGVTLGALQVRKEDADYKRHPSIEDNVVIYSGATILGGKTIIGHDSVIGGNVWLTESLAPYSMVYHKSQIRIRTNQESTDIIDFII